MTLLAGILSGVEEHTFNLVAKSRARPRDKSEPYELRGLEELEVYHADYGVGGVVGYFGSPKAMSKWMEWAEEAYDVARSLRNYARKRPVGYISNLTVESHARGSGLGRALMLRWISEARKRGVGDIYLWPFAYRGTGGVTTTKLIGFYKSLGFVAVKPTLAQGKVLMVLKADKPVPGRVKQLPLPLR